MSYEEPDHAAEWLGEDTRRRRSGMTARAPRPARESLYCFTLERSGIATGIPVGYTDTPEPQSDTALARLMDTALERLSPRQRAAIELVVIAGMSYDAAAIELGVAKGTVFAHVRDGLRRMRRLLREPWAAALVEPWLHHDESRADCDIAIDPAVA
jgi:RNA polymerase sigma factor (sigma-70 family)